MSGGEAERESLRLLAPFPLPLLLIVEWGVGCSVLYRVKTQCSMTVKNCVSVRGESDLCFLSFKFCLTATEVILEWRVLKKTKSGYFWVIEIISK